MSQAKKRVLIIDDEPDTLTYFASLLEDNGYAVVTAKDGEEGLAKVKEQPPDLITLDVSMPEKSGVRFYREIKESGSWQNLPVIIVTGVSGDFKTFISTRKQIPPPEGYMSKPIDAEEFLMLVKKLIS